MGLFQGYSQYYKNMDLFLSIDCDNKRIKNLFYFLFISTSLCQKCILKMPRKPKALLACGLCSIKKGVSTPYFRNREDLKLHESAYHIHKCSFCRSSFSKPSLLVRHLRTTHQRTGRKRNLPEEMADMSDRTPKALRLNPTFFLEDKDFDKKRLMVFPK